VITAWEYHRVKIDEGTLAREPHLGGISFARLEELGSSGWEMIGVIEDFIYFLKIYSFYVVSFKIVVRFSGPA